ncbi:MAG: ABC transporter permease [Ottowia sp.]|nr:ABC transporter permease [Ottowia sp.]
MREPQPLAPTPADRPAAARTPPRLHALPAANDGWKMLLKKEVLRFWRVSFQTIAAPVLTAVLYLMIFGHVLQGRVEVYPGVSYVAFLVPGLVMMSVLQNAFANSASSLVQSKIMGNLVFTLLTPMTAWHWFVAYSGAAIARGLLVGLGVYLITLFYAPPQAAAPLWIFAFALLGSGLMGVLGLLAGLWADKFDQMAVFQNFIVMPMTFLAGVFYSIHSLPTVWQTLSHLNPFFYMIDGFRYGFFGVSDVSPWLSLAIAGGAFVAVSVLTLRLLQTGYKLRT